jgi:hypothetical protein
VKHIPTLIHFKLKVVEENRCLSACTMRYGVEGILFSTVAKLAPDRSPWKRLEADHGATKLN